MFWFIFVFFWLFMLFFQCRSREKYDGNIDMKNYTFCSNLIMKFPRWLIYILFFNNRLIRLPLPIVVWQIINYALFATDLFLWANGNLTHHVLLLKVWGCAIIGFMVIMCIDHEIYQIRNKR